MPSSRQKGERHHDPNNHSSAASGNRRDRSAGWLHAGAGVTRPHLAHRHRRPERAGPAGTPRRRRRLALHARLPRRRCEMKRAALLLLILALPVCAAPTQYHVKPVYTSLRFSIVKWGVLKEEGIFRDFDGTLIYDPAHPEASRIDVVAKTASLDTKNSFRDETVTGADFLDAPRYPTIEFHSTGVDHNFVTGNLTIHGTTR